MNLVIVESPAKAGTIEKFLGKDYKVTSSYGHIRDLKKHEFSIDVDHHFTPIYEIPDDKRQLVDELKANAKKAKTIWLASDEDREGEAIAWHLYEVLGLRPDNTRRIVFHEITKPAILHAIETPREIDLDLVNAQQARRVLDRIVGFELSPLLWKKVKPSLSAGRVQSVAVRLIVEREREIQDFKSEETYRITAVLTTAQGATLTAELSQRFKTEAEARAFMQRLAQARLKVSEVQKRPLHRQPAPPFTTSTLQQEAARKLHFTVSQTMSVAQRLYEAGKITYMRTDSVNLSTLAIDACKRQIVGTMGKEYLQSRNYTTHSKGAQEAHEAIRPTYIEHTAIEGTTAEQRLYELIWKRTIASQMADAQIEKTQINIDITGEDELQLVAIGEVVRFEGFLKVYMESSDDETASPRPTSRNAESAGAEPGLPAVAPGEALTLDHAEAVQRFSQHPMRYTEASLVKKMEELGIGRPSTYAPTISTIIAREYVERSDRPAQKRDIKHLRLERGLLSESTVSESYGGDKGKLVPTDIGIVVNDFLTSNFQEIMSYNFTANVESDFDRIADGQALWTEQIETFYKTFHPLVEEASGRRSDLKAGERILGTDPQTGQRVSVKISRFGPVVQIGTTDESQRPRFAALQKGMTLSSITLEEALSLFELPKDLGTYEDQPVTVGMGKYGPYVRHNGKYVSVPAGRDVKELTLSEAIALIEEKREEDRKKVMRTFDEDPDLQMLNGRYGPYLVRAGKNYRLPRRGTDHDVTQMTYEDCMKIIEAAEQAAPADDHSRRSAAHTGRRTRKTNKG